MGEIRNYVGLAVVGSILIAGAGCSTAPKPAETAKVSDSDIENAIKHGVRSDTATRIKDLDVDADTGKNSVTVGGTVYSQAARSRVLAIIQKVQPGYVVTDKIEVKPMDVPRDQYTDDMAVETRESARGTGETIGDSLEDAWIHTKVKAKLAGNSTTDASDINVDVENNIVTLRGRVASAQAKVEATRVATGTDGVRRVNNQLKVN